MMNDDYNEKETVSAGSSQDISDFPEGFEAFDEAEDEIGEVEDLPEAEAETGAEEEAECSWWAFLWYFSLQASFLLLLQPVQL